jgi:hypothetical protein
MREKQSETHRHPPLLVANRPSLSAGVQYRESEEASASSDYSLVIRYLGVGGHLTLDAQQAPTLWAIELAENEGMMKPMWCDVRSSDLHRTDHRD